MDANENSIKFLFLQWAGTPLERQERLSADGSSRQYFRCWGGGLRCVAALNGDVRENGAFFYFADVLHRQGIRVPALYAVSADRTLYLQEDVGDTTMYSHLLSLRRQGLPAEAETTRLYRQALDDLLRLQQLGRDGKIDFSKAYPHPQMDGQALLWDFNYFKYDFLKLLHVPFDEEFLEKDFRTLTGYLLEGNCHYLLYRDFQPRNIMMAPDGALCYIDFQGARQGSPLYDVASLLYSSKSELTPAQREALLDYYLSRFVEKEASGLSATATKASLQSHYYAYVLARMMQTMGTYGYRGLYEGKDYFIQSIPLALHNLQLLLQQHPLSLLLPELERVWHRLLAMAPNLQAMPVALPAAKGQPADKELTLVHSSLCVQVFSFSYRKGYPPDASGNGGGYAFDCRALPNPGRYEQYKTLTGKDPAVIRFLESRQHAPAVDFFFQQASALVCQHVDNFVQREFNHLMIGFGCTGGRHRSVYLAERMGRYLRQRYPGLRVEVRHCEQSQLNSPTATAPSC